MGLFSRKKRTTATIRRIRQDPPPGAPAYYWTFVLFETREGRTEVKLTKRQAKKFLQAYGEGELLLPPHVRNLYQRRLGEPVFLDIRQRDPSAKLADLARQMLQSK